MDENKETAPAEQGAPPAAPPAAEQSAPTKSANETKLEGQLATLKTKSEGYKKERDTARGERDKAVQEVAELKDASAKAPLFYEPYEALSEEQFDTALEIVLAIAHQRGIVTTPAQAEEEAANEQAAATATQEPSEEDSIRDILKRNGLKKCWMLPSGPCFSEAHAQEYAGAEFDSLTVISVEDAPAS